ncbi:MAG TPA: methyltransferase [Thiolinea sp.]|nr:methyltransferase [Thiolinea sp.]
MQALSTHPVKIWAYQQALKLATNIQAIPAKVTPAPFRLLQISSAFWHSRALYVATRLQIADALADKQLTIKTLAEHLQLDADHLYRLLRLLAALGVFEELAPKTFINSASSHYLRSDHPQSIRAMILLHNSPEMSAPWFEALEDSIRSGGIPFQQKHGEDLFAYMDSHPEFDRLFSDAMSSVEHLSGTDFLQDFNWGAFTRLIDVGGSTGHKTLSILQAHPNLQALVFDRPQVVAQANWAGQFPAAVLERISFQGGDFFTSLPAAQSEQDLYVFSAIFHTLSDTQGKQVLANLKTACGAYKPWVLIADAVVAEAKADSTLAAFDMQMLMGTQGRERSLSEWKSLLQDSGFSLVKVLDVRTFAKFLVLRKD